MALCAPLWVGSGAIGVRSRPRLADQMITSLYGAALAAVFVYLSARTIALRRKLNIAVGDGGNLQMLLACRAQANCAEYAPIGLLLLLLAELQGASAWFLNAAGASLLAGRIAHAWGLSRRAEANAPRAVGIALTFASLLSLVAGLLWMGLPIARLAS